MSAPARPAARRPAVQRFLMSVDLVWQGTNYRIREDIREQGAVIRQMDRPGYGCYECGRPVRPASAHLMSPGAGANLHPACAIRCRWLIPVGKSESTTAPEHALAALEAGA